MTMANRSLLGFIDLTLILLGSVALIAEYQQHMATASAAEVPHPASDDGPGVTVPIARLFEPEEARLSPSGRQWIAAMARRSAGRSLLVAVTPEPMAVGGRLDAWERAAARTGAIMHAFEAAGHPANDIAAMMPGGNARWPGITITAGKPGAPP